MSFYPPCGRYLTLAQAIETKRLQYDGNNGDSVNAAVAFYKYQNG